MQHLRSLPWALSRSIPRLTRATTLAGVLCQPSPSTASFSSTVPSASKRTKLAWKAQQYRSQRPPRSQLEPVPSNKLWLSGFSEETTREGAFPFSSDHPPPPPPPPAVFENTLKDCLLTLLHSFLACSSPRPLQRPQSLESVHRSPQEPPVGDRRLPLGRARLRRQTVS